MEIDLFNKEPSQPEIDPATLTEEQRLHLKIFYRFLEAGETDAIRSRNENRKCAYYGSMLALEFVFGKQFFKDK